MKAHVIKELKSTCDAVLPGASSTALAASGELLRQLTLTMVPEGTPYLQDRC